MLLLESLVNPILVVDSKAEVQSAAHKGGVGCQGDRFALAWMAWDNLHGHVSLW